MRCAHLRKVGFRFGAHQRAGQCAERAPDDPAHDDRIADRNAERTEQRNRAEYSAAFFAARFIAYSTSRSVRCRSGGKGEFARQADIAEQRDKQQIGDEEAAPPY